MEPYEKIDINHEGFKSFFAHRFPIIVFLLLLLNVVVVDVWLLQGRNVLVQTATQQITQPTIAPETSCSQACITQIKQATAAVQLAVPTAKTETVTQIQTTGSKEFYVPFGSGTNASSDWQDVGGLQAYIDSTKYSTIKNVTFEASVHIPTGNQVAYVRLFNSTDQHPVWNSEVSLEGGTAKFLVSSPITLDVGEKLYKVQMKTSLKFQAVLDTARVHILLQ